MNTYEDREREVLAEMGLDPAEYQIQGDVAVPRTDGQRAPSEPTPQVAPQAPDKIGPWETVGRSAIGAIPETLGGLVGGGLGLMGAGALGLPSGPGAAITAGLGAVGGAIGGSYGVGKAEERYAPQDWKDFTSAGGTENPIAAEIGQALPQLAASNPLRALQSLKRLIKATPTLTRFTPNQWGQVANLGVGAGLGAGTAIGQDALSEEGVTADTALKALVRGGAGILGAEPNKIGQMASLGQFKPSQFEPDQWAGAPRAAARAMRADAKIPTVEGEAVPMQAETDAAFRRAKQLQAPPVADAEVVADVSSAQPGQRPPVVPDEFRSERIGAEPPPEDPNFTIRSQQKALPESPYSAPAPGTLTDDNIRMRREQAKRAGYPQPERLQDQPQSGLLGTTTDEWDKLILQVAERSYGADVETGLPGVKSADGVPVAGKVKLPGDLERAAIQLSKNAGIDTGPHEILHVVLNDVLERGTPGEQRFARRVMEAAGGEEALVQGGGQEFVRRLVDEAGGREPGLLKDLASFIRARYLGRGTKRDMEILAANTLRRGAGSAPYRPEASVVKPQPKAPSVMEGEKRPKKLSPEERTQPLGNRQQLIDELRAGINVRIRRGMSEERAIKATLSDMETFSSHETDMFYNPGKAVTTTDHNKLISELFDADVKNWAHPYGQGDMVQEYLTPTKDSIFYGVTSGSSWYSDSSLPSFPGGYEQAIESLLNNPDKIIESLGEDHGLAWLSRAKIGQKIPRSVDINKIKRLLNDNPIPERPETINEQLSLTADLASTKKVTLLPPGSPEVSIPAGLRSVDVPQGRAVYNPEKLSEAEVVAGGSGEQYDGRLLGMSQAEKPADGDMVVTTSRDGVGDVVTEAVAPGGEAAAAAAQRDAVPGGKTKVKPAADVVNERTQPLGPREVYGKDPDAPKRSRDIFMGPVRKLEKATDTRRQQAGDVFRRLFSKRDETRGAYSEVLRTIEKSRPEDAREAYEAMIERQKTGTAPGTLSTAGAQEVYDAMDSTYAQMAQDQIAAGQLIGGRNRGVDPVGMFNVPARETLKTLVTQQGSARWNALRDDYINENVARGFTQAEAEKAFTRYIDGVRTQDTASGAVDFGAVSLPEGTKLPTSWIDPDPFNAWRRYIDQFSRARSWFDIVENDPNTVALFSGDLSLVKDPDVVEAFNSFREVGASNLPEAAQSAGRLVNSALLGPVTRTIDLATTPFKAMAYTPVLDIPGMFVELTRLRKHYHDSFRTGFNRPGGDLVQREILGAHDAAVNGIDRAARGMSKYQGSEAIEEGARTVAQGFGNYISRVYRSRALAGDAKAKRFLDRFGSDWDSVSDEVLGTRVGRLFQGNYDARNLPQWMRTGGFAPFVSLAKWSAEQWNNFRQFGIEPLVQHGDAAPLLKLVAAHLGGGAAVLALREWMTGKKPYLATWEELKAAPDGPRKQLEYAIKIGQMLQAVGLAGIPGDALLDTAKYMSGKMAGGFGFPLADVTKDTTKRAIKATQAIAAGVPVEDVMQQALMDIAKRNLQLIQLVTRNTDARTEQNATRDFRMYNSLRGQPGVLPVENVDYTRAAERAFDAERDPTEARQRGAELYQTARAKFLPGDPRGFSRELRKLRSDRLGYMPVDPYEQRKYLDFVKETQGQEKARELLERYSRDRQLMLRKRGMVSPARSGE